MVYVEERYLYKVAVCDPSRFGGRDKVRMGSGHGEQNCPEMLYNFN